jgi:hypothetical protein
LADELAKRTFAGIDGRRHYWSPYSGSWPRAAADNSRVDVHGMNMIDFDNYNGREVTRGAVAVEGNVPNGLVMR